MSAKAGASDTKSAARLSIADVRDVVAVRFAVSAGVLLLGFRAVSDDDFSRVVIAEQFAAAPRLDPSGTSWLPLPFWLNGAAMLAFGRSLLVAQIVALLLGVAASLLVALTAHRLTSDRRAAVLAGGFASLIGWSAWLGVATVPESLTAALTFFAAASLASRSPAHRAQGALALLIATLSRYEPWPVALAFALGNVALPVARGPAAPPAPRVTPRSIATSLLGLAGPLLWIAWNRAAHGDPLHFVARVTAYRRALGEAPNESVLGRLVAYPVALAREMPEVVIPTAIVLLLALDRDRRPAIALRLRRHAAPLALAAAQIAALSLSLVKDGAPTHHPERAVLFPALALAALCADVASLFRAPLARAAGAAFAIALLARAVVTPGLRRDAFVKRSAEVDIGAVAARTLAPGAKAFIEIDDYGYFAILAASGRPEDFVLSRDIDPRHPTEAPRFRSEEDFAAWLHGRGIGYLITPGGTDSDVRQERWGVTALRESARFGLWQVPSFDSR